MSTASTLPAMPTRPWLLVLGVVFGTVTVVAGWWAGQRAEENRQAELATEAPVSAPPASASKATGAAASASPTSATATSAVAGVVRPRNLPSASPAASASPSAGLSPLPWPFWEYRLRQPLPPRSPPLVPPPWRMIGATQSAGGWSLVVLRQGRTAPEFFKVGESLPGGYRVAAISQDDVTLESGGRTVVLSFIGTR